MILRLLVRFTADLSKNEPKGYYIMYYMMYMYFNIIKYSLSNFLYTLSAGTNRNLLRAASAAHNILY